jgi:hypothetical protein
VQYFRYTTPDWVSQMIASDRGALIAQERARQSTPGERRLPMSRDAMTQDLQIDVASLARCAVQRRTREVNQSGLAREREFVIQIDHRLAREPGGCPSAPAKISIPRLLPDLFVKRQDVHGWHRTSATPSLVRTADAGATGCCFHCVI